MKITYNNSVYWKQTVNGTAPLVEAISSNQKEYKSTRHYKIQFVSRANVDRSEMNKMTKNSDTEKRL